MKPHDSATRPIISMTKCKFLPNSFTLRSSHTVAFVSPSKSRLPHRGQHHRYRRSINDHNPRMSYRPHARVPVPNQFLNIKYRPIFPFVCVLLKSIRSAAQLTPPTGSSDRTRFIGAIFINKFYLPAPPPWKVLEEFGVRNFQNPKSGNTALSYEHLRAIHVNFSRQFVVNLRGNIF